MATENITVRINAQDRASAVLGRFSNKLQQAAKIAGVAAAAGLAASAKAAIDFESSFAGVRKTVDASEAEFAQLAQNFRNIAKEVPTNVNELNKLGEIAGQLGIEGVDNITQFTTTIAMLGDTTDVSGEEAALSLSRLMNVMGTAQGDIDKLGSTVVALGNNFAARESEIIDISRGLASFGQQIGLTESQVLAFGTAIAASGGESQAASTAFQKVALSMKDAVITGNKDLQHFADVAGVSAQQFKKAFEKDAGEAVVSFIKGLKSIDEAGGSTTAALEELGLADQRLIREFGKVAANADDLTAAIEVGSKAWEENTALSEEAEKRYKTTASQLKILWNRITDVAIVIGSALLPAINGAAKWLGENLTPAFEKVRAQVEKWMPKIKEVADQIASYLGPKLQRLWEAINKKLIPAMMNLWKNVIEPLIPIVGTVLVVAIGLLIDALTFIVDKIDILIPALIGLGAVLLGGKVLGAIRGVTSAITASGGLRAAFGGLAARLKSAAWLNPWGIFAAAAVAALVAVKQEAQRVISKLNGIVTASERATSALASAKQLFDQGKISAQEYSREASKAALEASEASRKATLARQNTEGFSGFLNFITGNLSGNQLGGTVRGGRPTLVGEAGPEVIIPPTGGGTVVPNNRLSGGNTVNLNVNVGVYAGTPTERRNVARQLFESLSDVARSQGMSVQEMLQ